MSNVDKKRFGFKLEGKIFNIRLTTFTEKEVRGLRSEPFVNKVRRVKEHSKHNYFSDLEYFNFVRQNRGTTKAVHYILKKCLELIEDKETPKIIEEKIEKPTSELAPITGEDKKDILKKYGVPIIDREKREEERLYSKVIVKENISPKRTETEIIKLLDKYPHIDASGHYCESLKYFEKVGDDIIVENFICREKIQNPPTKRRILSAITSPEQCELCIENKRAKKAKAEEKEEKRRAVKALEEEEKENKRQEREREIDLIEEGKFIILVGIIPLVFFEPRYVCTS